MGEAPHAGRFHYGFVTEHYNWNPATKLYGAAQYRLRPEDFGEYLLSRMS